MRSLLLTLIAVLLAGSAFAQLNFAISGGAVAFTPLNQATARPVSNLTPGPPNSATIKPAGFLFPMGGNVYHEFRARDVGVVQFGFSPNVFTTYWTASPACARMIAPFLHVIAYNASSKVSWEVVAGVLIVEWLDVEDGAPPTGSSPLTFSFQVRLDSATGEIEFHYSAATGTPYMINTQDCSVSVTGETTPAGRCFVPGTLAGFVDANGRLTQWPDDSFIRFTPTGQARNAPTATIIVDGAQLNDNEQMSIVAGTLVAALNIQITVEDAEGDPASVTAEIISPTLLQSEFESISAGVPYVLQPTRGTMAQTTSHMIQLTVDGGQDGRRVIRIGLYVPGPGGGGSINIDPLDLPFVDLAIDLGGASAKGVANCFSSTDGEGSGRGLVLLAVVAGFSAVYRRLRVQRPA